MNHLVFRGFRRGFLNAEPNFLKRRRPTLAHYISSLYESFGKKRENIVQSGSSDFCRASDAAVRHREVADGSRPITD
jgi:hypothetical protein